MVRRLRPIHARPNAIALRRRASPLDSPSASEVLASMRSTALSAEIRRMRHSAPGDREALSLHYTCLTGGAQSTTPHLFPFLRNARMLNPVIGRRRLAREALAARRGDGKSSRKPLKTSHRAGKQRRARYRGFIWRSATPHPAGSAGHLLPPAGEGGPLTTYPTPPSPRRTCGFDPMADRTPFRP
jgi:hypothetical protein